ncbi:MAG: SusC/RagA family protein [Gammaproteobacteria bacterium]|nr:MAG: SusC/RagA family protein [Gammaproteobacteria bacterium]
MKRKVILKRSLLLFLSLMFMVQLSAQNINIKGTVRDATNGDPLPGATVVVPFTTIGTATNYEGYFELTTSMGEAILVSFVGYESQQVSITDETTYEIELSPSTLAVDELVVIGYGKVKKSDATGSLTSVSSKDFNKGAITSAQELLMGKSAGVVITSSSGAPGSGSAIRIRGGSSLNASNDPLIIIDGVPIDNNSVSGSPNFLSVVNPNDIETMTILKDASATAIYGSRASNGVIIITTKKGVAGRPMSISYNGNTSVANAIEFLDLYSGDELRQIAFEKKELFGEDNLSLLGSENTNWQQELFRPGISQDHNISVSGSYKTLPYRASIGYTDQNGIMKNTDMQRVTGSVSLNPTFLDDALQVNVNVKAMNSNNNFGDYGALGSAVTMDPTQPIFDGNPLSDGYFQWSNYGANLGTANPVEQLMVADNRSVVNRAIANVQLNYTLPFLRDLKANLNVATDRSSGDGHNYRPITTNVNLDGDFKGRETDYSSKNTNDLIEFYLNYNKEISGNQTLDVTAGYSWQHFQREGRDSTRGLLDIGHPDYVKPVGSSFITENYLVSFFGRVNYSLMSKYLFTATIRNDGSSRFAEGNRWGLFPSAAVAWKISEESFLEGVDLVSDLKLRASWGITGQQDIGSDYPAQAIYRLASEGSYYPIGGEFLPTLRPDAYDPNIKWEETSTQNIGLDFGFMKNRISGSVDLYHRVTEDLLNTVTIPSGSNFSNTLLTNVGSLENKAAEVALNLIPISTQDMNLTLGFNATYNVNEITKLLLTDDPEYIGILYGSAFTGITQVTRVGYPAYSYFLNKQVYDQDGNPVEGLYADLSGEGGVVNGDNADKYIYHNPVPDFLFGLSARFNYKNFDFAASSRANIGNYVYNQIAAGSSYDQMYQIGYWKTYPKMLDDTQFVKRQFTSDYFVDNASFFKLDNVSAGYTFENIVDKMNARVSFTVQNAITITKYKGIDPEVAGGIDNNFYPRPRTFMIGLSLTY